MPGMRFRHHTLMPILKLPKLPALQTNHQHSHNLSFTYIHKLDAVRDGRCTWTGRMKERFSVDDKLTLYTWAGAPYKSKWGWCRKAAVEEVVNMTLFKDGILLRDPHPSIGAIRPNQYFEWDSEECDRLAAIDFIDPPSGVALQSAWLTLNASKIKMVDWKAGLRGQHIRWGNIRLDNFLGTESESASQED